MFMQEVLHVMGKLSYMEHDWGARLLAAVEQNTYQAPASTSQETIRDIVTRLAAETAQSLAQTKVIGIMAMAQDQLQVHLGEALREQLQTVPIPEEARNAVAKEILQRSANFLSQLTRKPTSHQ